MNIAVIIWGVLVSGWKKLPWWIQFPVAILIAPNLIVNTVLFYAFIIPFFTQQFHTLARPYKEKRDEQISRIMEINQIQYKTIIERMDRQEHHQSLMYAEMLRRRGENP